MQNYCGVKAIVWNSPSPYNWSVLCIQEGLLEALSQLERYVLKYDENTVLLVIIINYVLKYFMT